MKRRILTILMTMLLCGPAIADSPTVGFWLVERWTLSNAVDRAGGLAKVEEAVLDEMATCRGHFKGSCDLWLRAGTIQFRLKAADDGKIVDYFTELSLPQVTDKELPPRTSQGRVEVGPVFAAKAGWEKERVVLVLRRMNLKE